MGIFGLCAIYFLLRDKEDRNGDTIYLLWSGLFYLLLNMFVFRLRAHRYFLPLMPILSIIAVNWILTAKREGLFKKIFSVCTVLAALIPTVIGVIVLYSGQISVNLWRNAQISDFQTQAIPFAIAAFALSLAIGLAGLKLYKKPAKFLAIAFGGLLLFYPFYFNATPDVDPNGQLQPDTLLAKNLAEKINKSIAIQNNYIFVASRRSLRIHPELHFFLHNTINRKGISYLATLPFQAHNFTRVLIEPAAATSILKTEKNGNIQTPLYGFLNTNKFAKTALILNNIEVSLLYRSLPSINTFKSKTEFVAVKGLGHEWKNEILYLVTLKNN